MSRIDDLHLLLGDIERYRSVSSKMNGAIVQLLDHDIPKLGTNTTTAMAAAGLIETAYTAVETVLFRIAQCFGNNLSQERWHSDLLHRMATPAPGLRPAVLSEQTRSMLDELMRFRHFKRYYFSFEYDWNRLRYLFEVIARTDEAMGTEIRAFEGFVHDLINELDSP
ncbi:MAG: hypothetical protein EA403_15560 [Spirochaetaceae bacterium]|nr:MAG: hypothetical protein EA403_15560 [Spirochaetaceae bacterium]